ncbi:MAG: Mut7-C RNAse domain-containing protein [Spirochaetia bacterium]
MPHAEFRFYEELNDFLRVEQRRLTISRSFIGTPTVKDTIESCGVPHTEIDLILVDGESVGFGHHLTGGERVAVYPMFEGFDISPVTRLRARPLRRSRFLVDANLGRLVRLLRLLGFDSRYDQRMDDDEIARTAAKTGLTILTRDRGLLMRRIVKRGYFVRSQTPRVQAAEVMRRFDLCEDVRTFTRCVDCNGLIRPVSKAAVQDRLPHNTRLSYEEFFRCSRCSKLFWRGAHWTNLLELVKEIKSAAAVGDGGSTISDSSR